MSDLVEFLRARLDEDERAAQHAIQYSGLRGRGVAENWEVVRDGRERRQLRIQARYEALPPKPVVAFDDPAFHRPIADFIALHDPARVLREVEAKRRIIEETTSWKHDYVDGDTWFSCGLADDPDFPDEDPGSGCADDDRRGTCNCGLGYRQRLILGPLALSYADHPDYREEP